MEQISVEVMEQEVKAEGEEKGGMLERLAAKVMFLCLFLLPIFFIPSASFPLMSGKAALFSLCVLAAFLLWAWARLKDGRFVFPRSLMLVGLASLTLLSVLSALASDSLAGALVGAGFEVGTAVNVFILSLSVFLIGALVRRKDQIFFAYLALFASFFIVAAFHLIRLLSGAGALSFGLFTDAASNLIGKWNDLGVFAGAVAILSLMTVEFLSLSKITRAATYLALAASLGLLVIVNFSMVWLTLGVFSLVLLVFLMSFRPAKGRVLGEEDALETAPGRYRIPAPTLAVLLLSVLFVFGSASIGGKAAAYFGISQIEARPSWQATLGVVRETLKAHPLLGAGPNQFLSQYLAYKPKGINNSVFWNIDFNFGVGLAPTLLVTVGLLGFAAFLLFFVSYCYAGLSALLRSSADNFSRYLIASSFFTSLFFWVFSIFYIPSQTTLSLTFLLTGLFLSSLLSEGLVSEKVVEFIDDPRAGFVSVLVLILLLIGGVSLVYALGQKYAASVYFQKGALEANRSGDIDTAEADVKRAVYLNQSDAYYRALAEISLARLSALLSSSPDKLSAETLRSKFQALLASAIGAAQQAVAQNPKDYQNFLELGRVYEAIVPLNIAGAYESAKSTYEQARSLNPHNPAILLTLARLEIAKKDMVKAREYIAASLSEKSNYTEAVFLLSQLEASQGNVKEAIASAEAAATLAPNDPTVFFQLGLLRFNSRDYKGAAGALEQAVAQNASYANAKYFLGLSYEKLGRSTDAIAQFEGLKKTNPDNKEVDLILRNLKAGRAPFADATPPLDDKPEKRRKLPVEEKNLRHRGAAAQPIDEEQ